jgi:hypothetical protein
MSARGSWLYGVDRANLRGPSGYGLDANIVEKSYA